MNLYGHVGLVLYGPSFVALHLNLYELVRMCMDCGVYKMFFDAYCDDGLFYGVSMKYMNFMKFLFNLGYHIHV